MIQHHLEINGIALIATKRFYFGVGGGSATLEELVKSFHNLEISLIASYEDGASNIRDIFQIIKTA
jgi:hypothetical protein